MKTILDIWHAIPFSAIIQVAILTSVIYSILKAAKGSRFGQALMGVGILSAALITFTFLFHFDVLTRIVQFLLLYLAISSVVIFQPEIRRILSQVGAFNYFNRAKLSHDGSVTPEFAVETILALAERKMGALLAFERGISLRSYEQTGVALDATWSRELISCIFTPPLPLHDGGLTIRNGRLSAAHCVLPVSNNPELISSGMRHRAAVGLSEETDALVIVVSEESGLISVAHNGKLVRFTADTARASLLRWLTKALPKDGRELGLMARLYALWGKTRLGEKILKGHGR